MRESEYIIQILSVWCQKFDGIHVRYAYDADTEYHIIEVDPESIRRGNESYKEAELSLWAAFMEQYPDSDLLITRPSEANEMNNCLFENNRMVEPISVLNDDFFYTLKGLDYTPNEQYRASLNSNHFTLAA